MTGYSFTLGIVSVLFSTTLCFCLTENIEGFFLGILSDETIL